MGTPVPGTETLLIRMVLGRTWRETLRTRGPLLQTWRDSIRFRRGSFPPRLASSKWGGLSP